MANELNIALAKSGLTVTAQRYQAGAAVGAAISCPEVGTSGFYSGNMTGTAGTYQVAFLSAGANVGSGSIVWDGTAEVATSAPSVVQIREEMDSNSTQLSAIKSKTDALPSDPADQSLVEAAISALSIPSAASVASAVRIELTEISNLDASVSSRLASASYTAPANSDVAAIKAKTDALPSDPADQSLLEAAIAGVTAPSAATVASAVRSELSSELSKVSALNTDRLAQCSTVSTTGAQLAAALS